MYKYLLELKSDENIRFCFGFKSYADRDKAIQLKNQAVEEWEENCLDAFHTEYEELRCVNCLYEYILYEWMELDYIQFDLETEWY